MTCGLSAVSRISCVAASVTTRAAPPLDKYVETWKAFVRLRTRYGSNPNTASFA